HLTLDERLCPARQLGRSDQKRLLRELSQVNRLRFGECLRAWGQRDDFAGQQSQFLAVTLDKKDSLTFDHDKLRPRFVMKLRHRDTAAGPDSCSFTDNIVNRSGP